MTGEQEFEKQIRILINLIIIFNCKVKKEILFAKKELFAWIAAMGLGGELPVKGRPVEPLRRGGPRTGGSPYGLECAPEHWEPEH